MFRFKERLVAAVTAASVIAVFSGCSGMKVPSGLTAYASSPSERTEAASESTQTSTDGTTASISFTVPASLTSNTNCTIVYPASAANAANTDADVATALATQTGNIATCPEVRKGTATIDISSHSLTSVTKLAAQNAIFMFTMMKKLEAATE